MRQRINTQKKYQAFRLFCRFARRRYASSIYHNDDTTRYYDIKYKFNNVIGGRNGGNNSRIFEIFWGARPFDSRLIFSDAGVSRQLITEQGATLRYFQLDNGAVVVTVFPAKTDTQKPIEDGIIIDFNKSPRSLISNNRINRHWNDFRAYMDVTALEGDSGLLSKLRGWKLRTFHKRFINNQISASKFQGFAMDSVKFISTVGLSGFVFVIGTYAFSPHPKASPESPFNDSVYLESVSRQTHIQEEILKEIRDTTIKSDSCQIARQITPVQSSSTTPSPKQIAKPDSAQKIDIKISPTDGIFYIDSKDSWLSKQIPWLMASFISVLSIVVALILGKRQTKIEIRKIENENEKTVLQLKANVLSENRQKWINDLRNECASFIGECQDIRTEYVTQKRETGRFSEHNTYKEQRRKIHILATKIELMLNQKEAQTLKILAALNGVRTGLYAPKANQFDDSIYRFKMETKKLLKSEWERVKLFE